MSLRHAQSHPCHIHRFKESHSLSFLTHLNTQSHHPLYLSHTESTHTVTQTCKDGGVESHTHLQSHCGSVTPKGDCPHRSLVLYQDSRNLLPLSGYLCLSPDFSSFLQFLLIPSPSTPCCTPHHLPPQRLPSYPSSLPLLVLGPLPGTLGHSALLF